MKKKPRTKKKYSKRNFLNRIKNNFKMVWHDNVDFLYEGDLRKTYKSIGLLDYRTENRNMVD